MWADAQRDGRPAEYRWRPLRKFCISIPCTTRHTAKFGWHPLLECCAVRCQYNRVQDLDVKWILHRAKFHQGAGAGAPKNVYIVYQPGDGQTSFKVWLVSGERCRCSNEGKTRNQLKFAGVPQTGKLISAGNGPKFTILWEHVEGILLFNYFL